jgi:2-hydroxychromene-2-carboxylate isomerase
VSSPATQPVFYYDLGSPQCYIVAELIMSTLPVVPEWEPVLLDQVTPGQRAVNREVIDTRARELGLQPLRWPSRWPPDAMMAMLAATYAKQIGRAVAFSLAAFRQAFAAGRDLGDEDTVLIAGAACEMHPTALLKGVALRSVAVALDSAAGRAREAGVRSLPAIEVDGEAFEGEDGLHRAARALEAGTGSGP